MADETELLEEDEAISTSPNEQSEEFEKSLAELKARCSAANIEYSETRQEDSPFATIALQAGKSKRKIAVYKSRAKALLAVEFEKYRFLSGYEAIYCFERKTIEASIRATRLGSSFLLQRLAGQNPIDNSVALQPIRITPTEAHPGRPIIEIGPSSAEFSAIGSGPRGPRNTLKLIGVRATQHDQALQELRSYADSLFFQIDALFGSAFILERQRRVRLLSTMQKRGEVSLAYPTAQYNAEAMSLYWYAKSARDMPLLRFLAFYQAIEFFFPRYSQAEARKRVAALLRSPTFRAFRDDDVDRLVSAIQVNRSGAVGNERSQLRSVVNGSISNEELRDYIGASKDREDYFSGRGLKGKYHRISLSNKELDIRNDVADRIYDIRCKIVHTKNEHSEDDIPMILPFSEDADYLLPDVDLVEFVARSVLISSSGELS